MNSGKMYFNQRAFVKFFKRAVKDRNTQGGISHDGWEGTFARIDLCHHLYQICLEKEEDKLYMIYDSHLRDISQKEHKSPGKTDITGLTLVFH